MRYVALRQREKGIYIISQRNEVELYRICEANISYERERVYRKNILASLLFIFPQKDLPLQVFFSCDSMKKRKEICRLPLIFDIVCDTILFTIGGTVDFYEIRAHI